MMENFTAKLAKKIMRQLNFPGRQNAARENQRGFLLSITTRCNFNCPYCLRLEIDKNKTIIGDLPVSVFETILKEGKKLNFEFVTFTGGEPVLHPHFKELVSLVSEYGYKFNFVTNGWLHREYWKIIEPHKKKLERIFLSLNGTTPEIHDMTRNKNGSFSAVLETIKFYQSNGLSPVIVFCVTKKNLNQIADFPDFCLKIGVNTVKWAAVLPVYGETGILNGDYIITDEERVAAFKKISDIRAKFKARLNFMLTMSFHPVEKEELWPRCSALDCETIYIDHDGGMLFCCDISSDYKGKPIIQELGFQKSLEITLNSVNEMKKKFLNHLSDNKKIGGFCGFCDKNLEECLDSARRQALI